jgi:stress-induced morphogen
MNATGPRQAQIEERLTEIFAPIFLDVQNTSHGQKSDESHFKVVVVSEAFEG